MMVGQTLTIDSIDFFVVHEGPPDGPLVVLSHALMANLHMWDALVTVLHEAGYSTLRYDHVGHHKTPAPGPDKHGNARSFHFDDFTRHMHAMVKATTEDPSRDPYAVIGCSMGGVLALRYTLLYPGTVAKVISCDAPGMTSLEVSKPKWHARMAQWRAEGTVENLARATVDRWFPPPCLEEVKETALQQTRSCTLSGYETCARAIMDYDYTNELSRIPHHHTQVMILRGQNDEAIGPPEVLEDVANRIRASDYVVMKDVGHLPPMHAPDQFAQIVLEFLQRPIRDRRQSQGYHEI